VNKILLIFAMIIASHFARATANWAMAPGDYSVFKERNFYKNNWQFWQKQGEIFISGIEFFNAGYKYNKFRLIKLDINGQLLQQVPIDSTYAYSKTKRITGTNKLAFFVYGGIEILDLDSLEFVQKISFPYGQYNYCCMNGTAFDLFNDNGKNFAIILHNDRVNNKIKSFVATYELNTGKMHSLIELDEGFELKSNVFSRQNNHLIMVAGLKRNTRNEDYYSLYTLDLTSGKVITKRDHTSCHIKALSKNLYKDKNSLKTVIPVGNGCGDKIDLKDSRFNFKEGSALIDVMTLEISKIVYAKEPESWTWFSHATYSVPNTSFVLGGDIGMWSQDAFLIDFVSDSIVSRPQAEQVFKYKGKSLAFGFYQTTDIKGGEIANTWDIHIYDILTGEVLVSQKNVNSGLATIKEVYVIGDQIFLATGSFHITVPYKPKVALYRIY
jgi:hypothetical protein